LSAACNDRSRALHPQRRPILLVALWLVGCSIAPERAPVIGEAYVGPATLPLRSELAIRATVVATVKHGDKLEIIGRRRRFLRVRAPNGAEGWTDSLQLLSEGEVQDLKAFAGKMGKLPSMGAATTFDQLNVHTIPNRQAPSFAQVPANGTVEVVGHQLVEKTPFTPPQLVEAPPKPAPKAKAPPKESSRIPPPPPPKPPEVPENWLELSRRVAIEEDAAQEAKSAESQKPPEPPKVEEDWSLVRLKDGRCGWVLTRLLIMAIPDEVAQYAERHRITSYFALGQTRDGDQMKPTWLWTTLVSGGKPYEFDGVRLFTWNPKRHRYETSFIDRGLTGYYPILATTGDGKQATFSLLLEGTNGAFERREYAFNGYRASLSGKSPAQPPETLYQPAASEKRDSTAGPEAKDSSAAGLRERAKSWWRRLLSK
jgi:hypothetical protein